MRSFKSKGFSMIELLLVIGLIAVISAVVFFVYPQVRDNNYANTERQRLLQAITVVQSMHFSTGHYDSLTTDSANQAGAFVQEANGGSRAPGTIIRNIWGGTIEMGPASNRKFMRVAYTQVSMEGCLKFATGVGHSFQSVAVNGVEVWRALSGDDIDVSATVEACNANPNGATIVFISN